MVKKYHQTRKDRADERRGMERREGKYHQTRKDREDERRGMERRDRDDRGMDTQFYGMIHEDRSEVANLPQHVEYKPYPKCGYFDEYELDDTIRGLDDTRDDDLRTMRRYTSKDKY